LCNLMPVRDVHMDITDGTNAPTLVVVPVIVGPRDLAIVESPPICASRRVVVGGVPTV
jgi:hypothetical protein